MNKETFIGFVKSEYPDKDITDLKITVDTVLGKRFYLEEIYKVNDYGIILKEKMFGGSGTGYYAKEFIPWQSFDTFRISR